MRSDSLRNFLLKGQNEKIVRIPLHSELLQPTCQQVGSDVIGKVGDNASGCWSESCEVYASGISLYDAKLLVAGARKQTQTTDQARIGLHRNNVACAGIQQSTCEHARPRADLNHRTRTYVSRQCNQLARDLGVGEKILSQTATCEKRPHVRLTVCAGLPRNPTSQTSKNRIEDVSEKLPADRLSKNRFSGKLFRCLSRHSFFQARVFQTRVFQTRVFQARVFQARMFQTRMFQARVFQARMFQARMFQTRMFQARVFQARMFQARMFQARMFQARMFQARMFQTRMFQARMFQTRVFQARMFQARMFQTRVFQARMFQARMFQTRVFQARVFQARMFQARMFQTRVFQACFSSHVSDLFQARMFQTRVFQARMFQARVFQTRMFQTRVFQVRLFQARLLRTSVSWIRFA